MNSGKIFKIARREYLETIKTKTFLISIILTPLLIIGIGLINSRMEKDMRTGAKPARRVAMIDLSGEMAGEVKNAFQRYNKNFPQRPLEITNEQAVIKAPEKPETWIERYKQGVLEGKLDALLVIAKDAAGEGNTQHASQYYAKTKNINDLDTGETIRRLLNESAASLRFKHHNLSQQLVEQLNRPVAVESIEVGAKEGGKKNSQMAMIMVPFFFMFLMFMGILGTSQGLLTNVIEEKNSRVMEVLLAAVSPYELMAGKIAGLAGVGLTLIGIWGGASAWAADHFGISGVVRPELVVYFIIYFMLGFLTISALYAAVGSACNSLKEAQNLLGPLTMLVVIPMIVWMPIVQNPNGMLAVVLSFLPTTASMVMIVRLSANPEMGILQIAASMVVLAAWAVLITWAAGKIFRTGILMYGKPPSLRELLRWVKAH